MDLELHNARKLAHGAVVAAFVFAPFFLGAFKKRAEQESSNLKERLTKGGLLWAVAMPACFAIAHGAFVLHVRLLLGRWPAFGEGLPPMLSVEHRLLFGGWLPGMFASLYYVCWLAGICVAYRPWRHVAVYAIAYAAAVGLAIGTIWLAPNTYVRWLLD